MLLFPVEGVPDEDVPLEGVLLGDEVPPGPLGEVVPGDVVPPGEEGPLGVFSVVGPAGLEAPPGVVPVLVVEEGLVVELDVWLA